MSLTPVLLLAGLPAQAAGATTGDAWAWAGPLLGLLIGHKELGMMGLIGIVMLMGLVTKNSILLVEYALVAMKEGMPRAEALRHAGRDRVRPILMTTVAMIAGMMPIALSIGEGTEELSPMAVAVIGGLITSTLLSLLYIPVVFILMDGLKSRSERLMRRIFGHQHHAAGHKPTLKEAAE